MSENPVAVVTTAVVVQSKAEVTPVRSNPTQPFTVGRCLRDLAGSVHLYYWNRETFPARTPARSLRLSSAATQVVVAEEEEWAMFGAPSDHNCGPAGCCTKIYAIIHFVSERASSQTRKVLLSCFKV